MEELLKELREQYAGNEIMLAVTDTIEKAYQTGYNAGFAAGEEAMRKVVELLTSPAKAN